MALTYEESALLMTDFAFRGRVKVACLKYATSLLALPETPNYQETWAKSVYQSPDAVAGQVQPPTVMDPAVQTDGSGITDLALQAAVEGVVNKIL